MKIRRIYADELQVGQALAWDVHGENGALLVRQGHVVANQNQIELLLERGFIADVSDDVAATIYQQAPSALRLLNLAHGILSAALPALQEGQPDALQQLEQAATLVQDAVKLDSDVALACILHNQAAAPYPVRHGVDTAVVAIVVARALKHSETEINSMVLAALTMNIGMLEQHERLEQEKETLPDADWAYLRAHPQAGADLLRRAGVHDAAWLSAVLQHHENEDGSGYPLGLRSLEISTAAKIIMLADRYCARVSSRDYRQQLLPNAALRDILLEANSTLNAQLASVLIRELGIYPIGTFVKLVNGEIGVVTRKGLNSTTPHVQSLVGPRGARLDVPLRRDTRNDLHGIREVLSAEQAALVFRPDHLWGSSARI
ncbi:HD-GYP domain-containing protein [Janthinobacterium agaricidamnosum]|uniref:HD domain protein n=1 Tax=Janthinobacterium agaricidamnosum NBRC 102515 = DSM 9628 TaxID=1349767 RepID=W0UYN7_9BURK|nr:HD domain-containing phosphohydrolase [Janthinobacterium agaricidamnosum]CDG80761.1 HD domain protein [Janthinobacterium agaricidamnosum NBRC 102515 = DSM 9628]